MDAKYYCGIDPGLSGGICYLDTKNPDMLVYPMPETEKDIVELIHEYAGSTVQCAIELVHSMPKNGVKSTFTFGKHYGLLRGALLSAGISFIDVLPNDWQKALSCQTKGDKNITKSKAQQMFPKIKVTHKIADAMLIAYWMKEKYARGH